MIAICVDDEELTLRLVTSMCRELPLITRAEGFSNPLQALAWLEDQPADLALLDIHMPQMDGLTLAARIKETCPGAAIIFLTGYAQYAVDAYALHPSGYVLKPVSRERLASEVDYALAHRLAGPPVPRPTHITVRTFGSFDLLVDGKSVAFSRSKAKELLAYLVDQQGRGVTRAEIFSALWEKGAYDRAMQKQLDVIIRSLRKTLNEAGVPQIVHMKNGVLRICPSQIDCDLYRFLAGEAEAVNAYRGEYMNAYPWASPMEEYVGGSSGDA